ncbi:hypothetical protein MMU07_11060 [Aquiflexum sp. LQ15W]|uniref:hypothetical protein n=1 Tax=Cognataquiflexum nitidum TaxID=2922272 RepID=UPI001F131A3B|nr:hypothetical protein [Cognataquiflexum nitidum]MCH6200124.1 hypothetical protein [Cognataquiflexum nitidum]
MKPQFVTDDHGKKLAVIFPINDYNRMMNELDELEDIKLYDAAKKRDQKFIDAEQAFKEIEKKREEKQK